MANRRFEMYQYRQVLVRMRLGESSRAIARSGLMGRTKVEVLREIAGDQGWLDPDRPLPDDGTLASALRCPSARPQMTSSVLPHQEEVRNWWATMYFSRTSCGTASDCHRTRCPLGSCDSFPVRSSNVSVTARGVRERPQPVSTTTPTIRPSVSTR